MKFVFGPLKSRRLGNSLGINLTPHKICSFDCVYCQLGKTTLKTQERKEYVSLKDILNELKTWLESNSEELKNINYITLSGSGEPTLNDKIKQLILEIKKLTSLPVAVLTNSSLLKSAVVRGEILAADLIVPSLDAVEKKVFLEIDRPQENIEIEEIIEGLIALRREFKGKIWLEVMLVRGINDDIRYIKKLKKITDLINPDKIQLNSPVRTTSEPGVLSVDKKKLEKIQEILGEKCEII
ncbi:MAG: radical SAM protein [Candidatus Omnitrophota bacterium]